MESLTNKLYEYGESDYYPLHMPGHKRRSLPYEGNDLISNIRKIDITEIDGFDYLHEPEGVLWDLKEKARALWNSDESFILVNGSTCGILAAICSQTKKGSEIIIARNSHKAAYNGLVIGELTPVFVYPEQVSGINICGGINALDIEKAIKEHPEAAVVFITSPTYEGVISDISRISRICHEKDVILIVDEAHGAHLGFDKKLDEDYGMKSAIECGADIVIQSIHKTLPAFTQTSLLHIRRGLIDEENLRYYLSIFQSSSPSYILMAGAERCFDLISRHGHEIFSSYRERLADFYKKAEKLQNLKLLSFDDFKDTCAAGFDIGKIVIFSNNSYMGGKELYRRLIDNYHLQPEMFSGRYVIAMTSALDDNSGFERLLEALLEIDKLISGEEIKDSTLSYPPMYQRYTIYEARERSKTLGKIIKPINASTGCVSAEFIYAYPPGIPLLIPGEVISEDVVNAIGSMQADQVQIHGLLGTKDICVIDE